MVANSRKTPSVGAVRPVSYRSLNLPAPVDVAEDGQERPLSITLTTAGPRARSSKAPATGKGRTFRVTSIDDLWQVDDEWWRERPISRKYYQVTTEDNCQFIIFRDQTNGAWYRQRGG
jgi:hypothetical protein